MEWRFYYAWKLVLGRIYLG
ncbi:hypothetical protein [Phytobacter massiliensis]|nr:hypothetical protein [Phytobacter massiliensis]